MKYTLAFAAMTLVHATAGAQPAPAYHAGAAHGAPVVLANKVTIRPDGIRAVTVIASDYAFVAPDTIPAGMTEIRLQNRGTEMHHVWLIRMDAGKTLSDLFASMKAGPPLPAWARQVGGPNTPGPGGESVATLRLLAGRYAMICVIPSPDGKEHVMNGMAKEIIVTPASSNTSNVNIRVSSTMTLLDYSFQFSQPLAAGRQTIRVKNAAEQSHEVVLARLQPGKTPADVLAWMEKMEGPPPAAPIGGTTPIARGEENIITVDLTPGDYALICFMPDAKDGKPHFVHGMVTQITVAGKS